MLSNSGKYAINAVLYLAIHSSEEKKMSPRNIASALQIPPPFLAKILQILAKSDIIRSTKGPRGGFFLTDEDKNRPLVEVLLCIDGMEKFTTCSMSLRECSPLNPCPLHHSLEPFRKQFLETIAGNTIAFFADKVKNGEAFLPV